MIVDIENDEVIKILAKDAISAGLYLVGDNINVCKKNGTAITKNLSCQILKASRFSRNLNSLMRNMTNKDHPLNRVLVKNKFNESCFWLLPDEAHLRHPYLREITQNKKSD
jgi:hypothetical protein